MSLRSPDRAGVEVLCNTYPSESASRVTVSLCKQNACLHTLPNTPACVWCTHGVKLWTLLKYHKLMSNIVTLKIPFFFFFFSCLHFLKPKCSFVLYDLFGHSSQTLFLSFNVGFFVFIQTGVWFDWTFILSKTHTDNTLKTLRRKESSPIPPSHSAEVLSPHMALYAIPVSSSQPAVGQNHCLKRISSTLFHSGGLLVSAVLYYFGFTKRTILCLCVRS